MINIVKIRLIIYLKLLKKISVFINLFIVKLILTFLYFIIFPFCYILYQLSYSRKKQLGWQQPETTSFDPRTKY